ncbi:Aspartyl/Asparaginyl beta-hydroxylase [Mucilaginibacter mallensis]|uniref:Aspartyl/Asparaginyl beta-hydroxylase n=1 Tax=Mucilaginibacter mallensis TaxID=652787 RepID=A0A1H1YPX8_MUCMA|nr:aspartyl/asparaginyl beta-hydroxylase domain-containing protein [Mucilaginibacter mallensis]SDT23410.1 Aspartyl/Asparaginyl beta-hydroxylase [Mucilaginibacter mallensis]
MIRYAKLSLPFDAELTQSELLTIKAEWLPHFNTSYYAGSWKGIALRSVEGKHETIIPELMGELEYRDTIYMSRFPSVIKLLSGFNCPVMSVRFLNLQTGAIIKEHIDEGLLFEQHEVRLHFPVFTNPGVEFYVDGERVIMDVGDCWYMNAHLPHSVTNKGTTDRIHLVVDCKVNDWLTRLIESSAVISIKENELDPQLLMVIKELRIQNTSTSNALADDMERQLNKDHA